MNTQLGRIVVFIRLCLQKRLEGLLSRELSKSSRYLCRIREIKLLWAVFTLWLNTAQWVLLDRALWLVAMRPVVVIIQYKICYMFLDTHNSSRWGVTIVIVLLLHYAISAVNKSILPFLDSFAKLVIVWSHVLLCWKQRLITPQSMRSYHRRSCHRRHTILCLAMLNTTITYSTQYEILS